MSTTIELTAAEADLVRVLDVLLDGDAQGRLRLPEQPVVLGAVRREVMQIGADRMARAALRFLLRQGGFRERTVLRDGRRVRGRLWDAPLNEGWALRFTDASRALWVGAARVLPALARAVAPGEERSRQHRRAVRDMIPNGGATGDWILHALVLRRIPSLVPEPDVREVVARKLRLASPLATLLSLDGVAGDAEIEDRLAPLTSRAGQRVLECVDDCLAASLGAEVSLDFLEREDHARVVARLASTERVLRVHLALLHRARRLDLARPLVGFFADLLQRADPAEVRRKVAHNGRIEGARARDEALAGVSRLFEVGHTLMTRRDELAAERYGDERYEEAQLFLGAVDPTLGPLRGRIVSSILALSGIVGGGAP
jgi:hypothetical protein